MSGARGPEPLQGIGDVKGFSPVVTPEAPIKPAPLFKSLIDTVMAFTVAIPTAVADIVRTSVSERSYPRGIDSHPQPKPTILRLVKPGFSSTQFHDPEN